MTLLMVAKAPAAVSEVGPRLSALVPTMSPICVGADTLPAISTAVALRISWKLLLGTGGVGLV